MQSNDARKPQWLIRGAFFAAGAIVGLLVMFLRFPLPQQSFSSPGTIVATKRPANKPLKPWGDMEALEIPLADSGQFFPDRQERLKDPHWFFENFSNAQLVSLFDSCGLTASQRTQMISQVKWLVASNGLFATPPPGLVASLGPEARAKIYAVLSRSGENYPQMYPFRFPPGGFDSDFGESGISPEHLQFIRQLTYTNNGTLCLADLELLPEVLGSNDFSTVLDQLYRFPAYRLRLRIFDDTDIDTLVKYWGIKGREHRIRPLLESLKNTHRTNGTSIGIGFLLPDFARIRLNTFPNAWTEPQVPKEDCFWTSLNFFNEKPEMRFLDPEYVREYLHSHYEPVQGQPVYGDLVTLVNEQGDGLHVCVYIADDFVFTKNGMNQLCPWVLMKIPDMLLYFASDTKNRLLILRNKEMAAANPSSNSPSQ